MIVNYSDQDVIKGEKSIFLAGPTPRNDNTISWRKEALKILEAKNFDGVVYVPEFSVNKAKEDYTDQAMWEREALIDSTIILFWIPRNIETLPAFTTNVEFGYYIHTGKITYGRPDNSPKTKYLDWLYEIDYNKKPHNNLESLIQESIELSNQKYNINSQEILPLEERKILERYK